MTAYYGVNYQNAYRDEPREKYHPGELGGTPKLLVDRKLLNLAYVVGDTIAIGKLPANSMIVDAIAFCPASVGATGIWTLGHAASVDEDDAVIAADPDGIIKSIDTGGQAVLARSTLDSVSLYKWFAAETEIFLTNTEIHDGSVLTQYITVIVKYVNK